MGEGVKVTDTEKLILLYERFRDVCWVEKEVWKEIFMSREVTTGLVRTNVQDRYEVKISDPTIEQAIETNISYGVTALGAVIQEHRAHIPLLRNRLKAVLVRQPAPQSAGALKISS